MPKREPKVPKVPAEEPPPNGIATISGCTENGTRNRHNNNNNNTIRIEEDSRL